MINSKWAMLGRTSLGLIVSATMFVTLPGTYARADSSARAGFVGGLIGGAIAVCASGGCRRREPGYDREPARRDLREPPRRTYRSQRRSTTRKKTYRTKARIKAKKKAPIVKAPVFTEAQILQQQLKVLGFYAGGIDGNLDSLATRDAIIGYQLTYGLPQTGHFFPQERQILQQQVRLVKARSYLENPDTSSALIQNYKIQAALVAYGLYNYKIDGKLGPISQKAISAFQQQNGMEPTGSLDSQGRKYLLSSAYTAIAQREQAYKVQLASIAQARVSGVVTASVGKNNQPVAGQNEVTTTGGILLSRPNVQPQLLISSAETSLNQSGDSELKIIPISIPNESLAAKDRPDAVAIIIGNRDYVNKDIPDVDYAHRDADAMKKVFVEKFGVKLENIVDLRDATKSQIEQAFGTEETIEETTLWSYVEPESDVYVFYSGHGMPTKVKGEAYILPVDADPNSPNISGYPLQRLYANLNKVKAKSITVFVEACFSGGSSAGMLLKSASPVFAQTNLNDLNTGNITVFTAARGTEIASWDESSGHGLFTKVAIDGLSGKADEGRFGNGDGVVTAGELQSYLAKIVKRRAKRRFKRLQNPVLDGNTGQVLSYLN